MQNTWRRTPLKSIEMSRRHDATASLRKHQSAGKMNPGSGAWNLRRAFRGEGKSQESGIRDPHLEMSSSEFVRTGRTPLLRPIREARIWKTCEFNPSQLVFSRVEISLPPGRRQGSGAEQSRVGRDADGSALPGDNYLYLSLSLSIYIYIYVYL